LILRLESGGEEDARLARSVALYVPNGEAVSPFLKAGTFKATWEGKLVLEKRSRLVFHLEGTGEAELLIDGEVLVPAIGESNSSKRLSSGEHDFVVEYLPPAGGEASLRLSWEGRDFAREPVPASAFGHDSADPELAKMMTFRHGRNLVAERRCTACHTGSVVPAMAELKLKGPSLDGVGKRLRQDWLIKWIANPTAMRPSAHMPVVFPENAEESAAHIAAYLSADAPRVDASIAATPVQVKKGGHIFHEQGCIACHTLDRKGDAERIGLGGVRMKFRHGALKEFLREPAKFHQGTRMPTFKFKEEELTELTGFLRSLVNDPGAAIAVGEVKKGRALAKSSGCFNCHERKDENSDLRSKTRLFSLKGADCSSVRYGFADLEEQKSGREAIGKFLAEKTNQHSLARSVAAEFAERQYKILRCTACHTRDGEETFREQFGSEGAHLQRPEAALDEEKPAIKAGPPPLTHLGLKLRPEWRAKLFGGQIDPKIRPWMTAKMPAFPSRAEGLAIGFSHSAGRSGSPPALAALDPAKVKIGLAMSSVRGGLACATCHGIADKPPIAVFEGEGPNLRDAGVRLSREYFHLWMSDPPRVWPGTIMPKYASDGKTPLTQHYEGDATKQFDAIFEYLRSLSQP
jgi:mono/diheme cytochrome c family protein